MEQELLSPYTPSQLEEAEVKKPMEGTFRLISEARLSIPRYTQHDWLSPHLQSHSLTESRQGVEEDEKDASRRERRRKIVERSTFYPPTATLICKWKEKCFRMNPGHFAKYGHPVSHKYVQQYLLTPSVPLSPPSVQNNTSLSDSTSSLENAESPIMQPHSPSPSTLERVTTPTPVPFAENNNKDAKDERDDPKRRKTTSNNSNNTNNSNNSNSIHNNLSTPKYSDSNRLTTTPLHLPPPSSTPPPSAITSDSFEKMISEMDEHQLRALVRRMRLSNNNLNSDYSSTSSSSSSSSSGTWSASKRSSGSVSSASNYNPEHDLLSMPLEPDTEPDIPQQEQQQQLTDSSLPCDDDNLNWNNKFQAAVQAIRLLSPNTRQEHRIKVYQQLAHHGQNFIYASKTYGRIIISEVNLEPSKKTIQPLCGKGFAGGDKYFIHGIYFKFAVDSNNLYGGDEGAMKVAGHELRHLIHVFNCWTKDIHLPMSVLVDYRGFRLIAMCTLPINNSTIVYGSSKVNVRSSDASNYCKVYTDAEASAKIKSLALHLNLREHRVSDDSIAIWTPVDLEAHLGLTDKKLYLLDFGRIFPPVAPDSRVASSYLVNLFRPEFVKKYKKPLCSDAFSPFLNDPNARQINDDIHEATEKLLTVTIPAFAKLLSQSIPKDKSNYSLIFSLHYHGINIRYLGYVRAALPPHEHYWRFMLLLEMLSRTIKQVVKAKLRQKMRELRQPGEEPYKHLLIDEFNLIFSNRTQSKLYWRNTLKVTLQHKFANALSEQESSQEDSLKEVLVQSIGLGLPDGRCMLFTKLSKMLGLVFSPTTMNHCSQNSDVFEFQRPFDETDVEDIQERVKHMNIVSHAEGVVLKIKASRKVKEEARRLYLLAIDKFKKALESNPDNKNSLRNLADCCSDIGNFEEAEFYYRQAIAADPEDTNSLFKYASFLDKYEKYDLAEEYYLRALEADPYHSNCLCVYADFLAYCKQHITTAEEFYKCALLTDKQNPYLLNNYACLEIKRHKYQDAEKYFKEAITHDNDNPSILQNYGLFLLHTQREEEAATYFKLAALKRKLLSSISMSEIND